MTATATYAAMLYRTRCFEPPRAAPLVFFDTLGLLAASKTLATIKSFALVLPPTSAFLPSRRLHQRKAGSAVAVISSEAGQPEKIALMPRVLVALASVGLRASSFTLATQRRQPNAFRRNMGALQSTAASSVSQQPHAIDATSTASHRPPTKRSCGR